MSIHPKDKWRKYLLMLASKTLHPYLPKTTIFSQKNFMKFVKESNEIIIKPNTGLNGKGVVKVTFKEKNKYEVHSGRKKKECDSIMATYRELKKRVGNRKYIIQKRIKLAEINGRPLDFRIIVQRSSLHSPWKVTGKMAKLAGEGYVVTNISTSNGKILTIQEALNLLSYSTASQKELEQKIDRLVIHSASILQKHFKKQRIFGMDIAIDQRGKIWIIEANLNPSMSHFQVPKAKKMLRTIRKYK